MPRHLEALLNRLAHEPAVLVTVAHTQGSVPRAEGTWMAVWAQGEVGTIGGGHLEWSAIRQAREALLAGNPMPSEVPVALGPGLGQCCGGRLVLRFERVGADDVPRLRSSLLRPVRTVALFGGGHVGRALVQALAPLPFAVHWIDSRDEIFPPGLPTGVRAEHSDPVQAAVADVSPAAHVLVMSFSHAEDLDIVAACLRRQRERGDLGFIGLIGSRSKWASFCNRLRAQGFTDAELQQVTCPIGLPGITDKAPEVIAASVVAQLLLRDAQETARRAG